MLVESQTASAILTNVVCNACDKTLHKISDSDSKALGYMYGGGYCETDGCIQCGMAFAVRVPQFVAGSQLPGIDWLIIQHSAKLDEILRRLPA